MIKPRFVLDLTKRDLFDHCDEICDENCDEVLIFDFDLDFDISNLVNQISSSGNNWVSVLPLYYPFGGFVIELLPRSLPPRALVVGLTNYGGNVHCALEIKHSTEEPNRFVKYHTITNAHPLSLLRCVKVSMVVNVTWLSNVSAGMLLWHLGALTPAGHRISIVPPALTKDLG